MMPEDYRAEKNRPLTGEEYLASLRDDREIYIYGDRVKDVTTHPAFRNAAASMAKLYDALHDPETRETLCWEPTRAMAAIHTSSFASPVTLMNCANSVMPSPSGRV